MSDLSADVIVAGGGLAGAAAALALDHAGFSVIVADPAPPSTKAAEFDGRAYAVALASERFWRAVGVWDRVEREVEPMVDIMVSDGRLGEGVSPLFLHLDHRELEAGRYGSMIEDRILHPAAQDAMAAAENVTHLQGVSVVSADHMPGFATATLSNGDTAKAALTVAADGRQSPLGAAAGIRRLTRRYAQNGLVCAVSHEHPHSGVAHEMFLPAGPFAILPLRGNRSSLVWTESRAEAERIHALDDEGYLAELRPRFGDFLGEMALEGRRWTYPLHLALAYDYVAPRLALLGDAAHAVHPIAGQG
ncbi:MAG: FAD-dependent monooxygenase, partial [Pseudomonadota bacterium]